MKKFLISPGAKVDLGRWDANDTSAFPFRNKEESLSRQEALREELRRLQAMLFAERKHKVLVVIQGLDASGKDGTVRNVFSGLDPQALNVTAFKAPSAVELEHDFLWRVHQRVPGQGEIAVFNRSHYEDIVAVRVKNLAPKAVWEKRYDHIMAFEKLLADEGTVIVKFFLLITPDEQRKRLDARFHDRTKQWKLELEDLRDRQRWTEFVEVYNEVLGRTSTEWAPWYVIPSNKKWQRNLIVASIVRDALAALKSEWPPFKFDPSRVEVP